MLIQCSYCGLTKTQKNIGRPPVYCSQKCKQAAFRFKKNNYQRKRVSSAALALSLRKIPGAEPGSLRYAGFNYQQTAWCD